MKYRSRTEIIAHVLSSAKELDGVTKTKIMFKAFLSHAQLKEYLSLLVSSEMLEHDAMTGRYKTTEKGIKMLSTSNQANGLISQVPKA